MWFNFKVDVWAYACVGGFITPAYVKERRSGPLSDEFASRDRCGQIAATAIDENYSQCGAVIPTSHATLIK